jgi:WD40 repeat protein
MRRLQLVAVCVLVVVPTLQAQEPTARPRRDLHGDPLPTGAVARLGSIRFLNEGGVDHLTFLPGDQQLLAGDGSAVCIWDVKTGVKLRRFAQANSNMCTALAPDKKTVAVAENGRRIFLLDVATGKELRQFAGEKDRAGALAWTPDGRLLAVGMGPIVYVWDTTTGALVHRLNSTSEHLSGVAISPNGKVLVTGDYKSAQLWDLATGAVLGALEGNLDIGAGHSLTFAPDGRSFVGACSQPVPGGSRSSFRQWDAATGKQVRDLGQGSGLVCAVAFTSNGSRMAVGADQDIRIMESASGKEVRRWRAHAQRITALAFTSDDATLASGSYDRQVRLWDPVTAKERRRTAGHSGPVKSVAFAPNGSEIASGGNADGAICFWEPSTGRELRRCDGLGAGWGEHWGVLSLAYAPDGKTLVSLEQQNRGAVFRLWETATAKQLSLFHAERPNQGESFSSAVVFARDNETILAANWDGSLAVWEPTQGKLVRQIGKFKERLTALALAPDGRKAAWVSEYQKVGVRDLDTGADVIIHDPKRDVSAGKVAFSPDSTTIAIADAQGPVRLWDTVTRRFVAEWPTMKRIYQGSIAFSPDGRLLAAGNEKGLMLWEIAAGQEIRISEPRATPSAIAFAPHGRTIVTGDWDGTLLVWDATGISPDGRLPRLGLTDKEMQARWHELTGTDGALAQRAIWSLAASAPGSLEVVKKHLAPVPREVGQKIVRLITDLDADMFAVRDRAMKELTSLGELAAPFLRSALVKPSSIETERRLEKLVKALDEKALAGRWLHTERALAVLEYAGCPEARQHLELLAGGAPQARLTSAARAALGR